MKSFYKINNILVIIEGWISVILFLSLMFFSFMNILLRALYTHADISWANTLMEHVDWSEPFSRLLVLYLTFLGATLITNENKHVKIDILSNILPGRFTVFRDFVLSITCLGICSLMLKTSIDYLKMEMEYKSTLFLGLPTWIGIIIIPAGFGIMAFRFLLKTIDHGMASLRGFKQ